jgi:UTP--glucose-1-phosphate uridylyltransferase
MKAVIPAAGLGTRFLPATKAVPKEMLPVLDKPTIQYVVEEALAAGVDQVVLVTSSTKPAIEQHFALSQTDEVLINRLEKDNKPDLIEKVHHAAGLPVVFVYQEEQLGSGHAVHCARELVAGSPAGLPSRESEPFFVMLGDVIVPDHAMLPKMLEISRAHDNASVIAVINVPIEDVSRFGIIAGEDLSSSGEPGVWRITEMVEKPSIDKAPSTLAIFGRYLLSAKTMEILDDTPRDKNGEGEIQLTDAIITLLAQEEIYAMVIEAGDGYDVGTVDDWLKTNKTMAEKSDRYSSVFC